MIMETWGISLDRDDSTNLDSFMELVENGEKRVYLEYGTSRDVLIRSLSPFVLGLSFTLAFVFIYALTDIVLNPLLALASIFLPVLAGFLLSILGIVKSTRGVEQFGVRGVPRPQLSTAISFLDMLSEGVADVGKIVDKDRPEEYSTTSSMGLGITVQVLNKIDPGLGSRWFQALSVRLSQDVSLKLKTFLRVTIFGTIGIVFFAIALQVFVMLRLIDSMFFLQTLLVSAIVAVVLIAALSIYVLRNQNANPPAHIDEALRGPEIRNETGYVLDHLLTTIIEEGQHPLRVLVLGKYNELSYTGRMFLTSKESILHEAILIPRAARL